MTNLTKRQVRCQIHPQDIPAKLIDFLAHRFTYHTRNEWLDIIKEQRITINDKPPIPQQELQRGDQLIYIIDNIPEPEVNLSYQLLLDDSSLLVINKPAGLPCHPAGKFFYHTLWALLKKDFNLEKLHFINRLDRETSGIILVAKDANSAKNLRAQFKNFMVKKEYQVVIEGEFPTQLTADGIIGKANNSIIRKKQQFWYANSAELPQKQQTCSTTFLKNRSNNGLSLIDVTLKTGRLHQIRATLCSLGYPVVGDKIYGVDETIFLRFIENNLTCEDRKNLRINRQALHAKRLTFQHPKTQNTITCLAPLPNEIASLLTNP